MPFLGTTTHVRSLMTCAGTQTLLHRHYHVNVTRQSVTWECISLCRVAKLRSGEITGAGNSDRFR
jgi:hypothetical protein